MLLLGHSLLRLLRQLATLLLLLLLPLLLPAWLSTSRCSRSCGRRGCSSGSSPLGPCLLGGSSSSSSSRRRCSVWLISHRCRIRGVPDAQGRGVLHKA